MWKKNYEVEESYGDCQEAISSSRFEEKKDGCGCDYKKEKEIKWYEDMYLHLREGLP